MSTFQSNMGSSFQTQGSGVPNGMMKDPEVQVAQQGAQQAVEFQLWVAKQSASLSKLKVFATMAKSINDQQ